MQSALFSRIAKDCGTTVGEVAGVENFYLKEYPKSKSALEKLGKTLVKSKGYEYQDEKHAVLDEDADGDNVYIIYIEIDDQPVSISTNGEVWISSY